MQSFQEIILTLKRYWAERGCVIQEPYDGEVGAGSSFDAVGRKRLELRVIRDMKAAVRNKEGATVTRHVDKPTNIGE